VSHTGRVIRRFLLLFVPLVALLGVVIVGLYATLVGPERIAVEINEQNQVLLQSQVIASDFRSVVADLMIVAQSRAMAAMLEGSDPQAARMLAEEFRLFAEQKGLYDQVRFLDDNGMEIVRVNLVAHKGAVVPEEQLQSKATRYYFVDAFRLGPGALVVSPLDLNVENGRVEVPPKPTIRFATPVVDARGRKRGVVVLNYLGENLLEKLRRVAVNSSGDVMLLNREGYWLHGPDHHELFAFMYLERRGRTFPVQYAAAWKEIAVREAGQFIDAAGMFTFRTIHPLVEAKRSAPDRPLAIAAADDRHYAWKIVSRVSPEVLYAFSRTVTRALLVAFATIALGLAVGSWLLARLAVSHREARERVLQSARLAAIGEAMTGLAHESRNALQRSQAGLAMLGRRVKDQRESLVLIDEIQRAQHDLHRLYEEVRTYAAPMNFSLASCDARRVVSEVWNEVARGAARPARFHEEGNGAATQCLADDFAIRQAFRNIFENALAAADPAEIRVAYSDALLGGEPALRISIRDNGPGLSREERLRIFEPFFTTKARGTGLGMAITRRVIESHGGAVEVGLGPGTEVIVTLPRRMR